MLENKNRRPRFGRRFIFEKFQPAGAGAGVPRPGSFGGTGFGGFSGSGVPAGAPIMRTDIRRRLGRRRERSGADDFFHLRAVERFVFEQAVGDDFQLVAVGFNHLLRRLERAVHDALHLGVNVLRGRLAVIFRAHHVAAEENIFLRLAVKHVAELLAHAPVHDHRLGQAAWPAGCPSPRRWKCRR